MAFALLLLSQLVAGPPAPASPPARIDLLAKAKESCEAARPGEDIVVCGDPEGDARYRLESPPERYRQDGPPKAETKIGDLTVAPEVEAASVGGFTSNRVMLRFKLPF